MKTKRISSLLLACSMLFCIITSCSDDLVDYNVLGSISGTVIDVDTHDPIQSVTVTLSPSGYNTYTGDDGRFEFIDLDARQYTVTVQKTGYVTNRKTVTTIAGGNVDISLTLQKTNNTMKNNIIKIAALLFICCD